MKKQEEPVIWDKSHHSIFEDFALDLEHYADTEEYPAYAGQDVKYGLELQFRRLKEKNLRMQYKIEPRGHFADGGGPGRRWNDNRYVSWMEYRTCRLSRAIYRDDHKVYEKDQQSVFYQIITNVWNRDAIAEEPYGCPNCGAVSKIADLQNGCPFCGTFFEMKELFPKVTNYYFIKDSGATDKELKHSVWKVMLPCMLIFTIGYGIYFVNEGAGDFTRIILSILRSILSGVVAGGVIGYMLWAFSKIGSMFVEAGRSIPMLINSAGSGRRFVSFMSRYSPEFSFEYFSDKVVSMLKMIIYSEDAKKLPYYEGESLGNRFRDVIESSYTGAVALKQYGVQGDYCYVTVDAYMENLYENGGHIDARRDRIRIKLRRNIRKPIDVHFSIERIRCKACGSSFNAAKMRNCPHCGTRYEMDDDDWIVMELY